MASAQVAASVERDLAPRPKRQAALHNRAVAAVLSQDMAALAALDTSIEHEPTRRRGGGAGVHKSQQQKLAVDLSKLEPESLERYAVQFGLEDDTHPAELLALVTRHFAAQSVDEALDPVRFAVAVHNNSRKSVSPPATDGVGAFGVAKRARTLTYARPW